MCVWGERLRIVFSWKSWRVLRQGLGDMHCNTADRLFHRSGDRRVDIPRFCGLAGLAALGVLLGCEKPGAGVGGSQPESKPVLVPITNMVAIRAGSFWRIRNNVTISHDFWIGKYEVTQAEFEGLMGRNPSNFKGDSNRPVEKLTWFDATAYCSALTQRERAAGRLPGTFEYRLPAEAEWEYACRANTTNRFSFGDDPKVADAYAWTSENSEGTTHPVGQKAPNPWGLHDIHGNVWEWCEDWFADYPPVDVTDPAGARAGKYRVFRGGSWNHEVQFTRSANRFMMSPSNGIHFVGMRVALGPVRRAFDASTNRPAGP